MRRDTNDLEDYFAAGAWYAYGTLAVVATIVAVWVVVTRPGSEPLFAFSAIWLIVAVLGGGPFVVGWLRLDVIRGWLE